MGVKLLWTGLTFILAVTVALDTFGLHASNVVTIVGAVFMLLGLLLLWLDK